MDLRKRRKQLGLTLKEVAQAVGVAEGTVSRWETGDIANMRRDRIKKLADVLQIQPSEIVGYQIDTPTSRNSSTRIKVYGKVPAGIPLEAVEDIIDWEDIPEEWLRGDKEYFGLMVEGYSMYPTYQPGDTIICLRQPDCESGQDAVVYVNGYNATLKRVIKQPFGILLQPLNPDPQYEAHFYDYDDPDNPISILGVVVELRRKMNR
ncbi:MAG: LexA family protein [Anaerovoracaceae bacterium]|jgi:repressor LexA